MRRLGGTGPVQVTVRQGRRDPGQVARIFGGTQWWLHPDGRLLVVPLPGLARDDLFPLPGEYWAEGVGLSFAAMGRVPSVAVGISGQLVPDADGWALAMTYETRANTPAGASVVEVAQRLTELSGLEGRGETGLPTTYRALLRGTVGGVSFADVPAEIDLLPAAGADPVEINIAGGEENRVGDLTWLASSEVAAPGGGRYAIAYTGQELTAQLDAPAGSMTITWTAEPKPPPGRDWLTVPMPVAAVAARLRLRFDGSGVHGTVTGAGPLMGTQVTYSATVDGHRVDNRLPDADRAFDRLWRPST
ncbi:hypothetical protein GCM10009681_55900 [Luedemannella helvata]|uniref:Uncharacterized protein n=1 Tax=Luedemannella helvata TaxID=349315 RepID=A0ABN2L7L7_9ACTN